LPHTGDGSHFKAMAFEFKIRDLFSPRKNILKEVGIEPGNKVLDFGCGPGGYILPTAKLVGESGRIYALDMHPLAIESIENIRSKHGLSNVLIINSDCETGLKDQQIDVILLYDVYHDLVAPNKILMELHRVLKPKGLLSFCDHHIEGDEIVAMVSQSGLFVFDKKGKKTYSFKKA